MIVRISRARFAPDRAAEMSRRLAESEASLRPALARLPGLRHYYVAVDAAAGSMVNVSVWDTLEDAQQMATLPEMLALRAPFEQLGVEFEKIINYETLWSV